MTLLRSFTSLVPSYVTGDHFLNLERLSFKYEHGVEFIYS
jgi:hypothetical protein